MNIIKKISLTTVLFILLFTNTTLASKEYREIDAAGTKQLMETDDALVVFPLSPIEFDHKHIKGAVNIIPAMLEYELPPNKERTIIFYCSGVEEVASWRAAKKAVEFGYKKVYAFREGISAWEKAGYPLVSTKELPDVDIKKISTEELSMALYNDDMTLLDINHEEDVQKFHIESDKRKHIPLDELNVSLPQLPKEKKIVIICLKGDRSAIAARYLTGKGYEDVTIVDGGIQKWILDSRPITREITSQ